MDATRGWLQHPALYVKRMRGLVRARISHAAVNVAGPPERRLLPAEQRLDAQQFAESIASSRPQAKASAAAAPGSGARQANGTLSTADAMIVDVRPREQFQMASIPGAFATSLSTLAASLQACRLGTTPCMRETCPSLADAACALSLVGIAYRFAAHAI